MFKKIAAPVIPADPNTPLEHWLFLGPPGSGKSTTAARLTSAGKNKNRFLVVDNDLVRKNFRLFQATLRQQIRLGETPLAADTIAHNKWMEASSYVAKWMLNEASSKGYHSSFSGRFGNLVTNEICRPSEKRDYRLKTHIFHVPMAIAQEAIAHRIKTGGHPTRESYVRSAYEALPVYLPRAVETSDSVEFYFRSDVRAAPELIATRGAGTKLTILKPKAFDAFEHDLETNCGVRNLKSILMAPRGHSFDL